MNNLSSKIRLKRKILGLSLVETIVAIAILVIGMQGFTVLFLTNWRQNSYIYEVGVASAAASRGVSRMISDTRRIRQADNGDYPIELGTNFEFTAYIDIDNDGVTERVHYYLTNRTIRRGVTEPTVTQPVTYPAGDQTTTTIVSQVDNEPSEPLFFYYNDQYPTVDTPLSTPIQVEEAHLIRIRIVVNVAPNKAPEDTTIESFAQLRNIHN